MTFDQEKGGEELRELFDGRAEEAPDGHALLGNVHQRSRRLLQRRTGITAGALTVLAAAGVVGLQNLPGAADGVPSAAASASFPATVIVNELVAPPGELKTFPLVPRERLGEFIGEYWYSLNGTNYTLAFIYTPQNGYTEEQVFGGAGPERPSMVLDTGPGVSITDGEARSIREGIEARLKVSGDDIVLTWSELGREWRLRTHLVTLDDALWWVNALEQRPTGRPWCSSGVVNMRGWAKDATDTPPAGAREIDFAGGKGHLVGTEADGDRHRLYYTAKDGTAKVVAPAQGMYATDDELIGEAAWNLGLSCHFEDREEPNFIATQEIGSDIVIVYDQLGTEQFRMPYDQFMDEWGGRIGFGFRPGSQPDPGSGPSDGGEPSIAFLSEDPAPPPGD